MIDRLCSERDPTKSCLERYEAVRRGSFWHSYELKGWLWSGSTDVTAPWVTCPWCGQRLPSLTDAILRALDEPEEE